MNRHDSIKDAAYLAVKDGDVRMLQSGCLPDSQIDEVARALLYSLTTVERTIDALASTISVSRDKLIDPEDGWGKREVEAFLQGVTMGMAVRVSARVIEVIR